jgi:pimeloyl-ACP methyl ester carboxylesterase
VEHQLVEIWEDILAVHPLGIHDDFFELGGDSLLAAEMVQRVEQVCGEKVPLSTLLAGPTIEHLAKELVKQRVGERDSLLVKIQSGGRKRPFFFLHGDHCGGGFYCLNLARGLGEDQPFYALRPLDRKGDPPTIEEMAATYITAVREVEPQGPFILGGWCHGGVVAFEMARQLKRQGEKVDLVVMIGPPSLTSPRIRFLRDILSGIAHLLRLGPDETVGLFLLLRGRWTFLRQLCRYSRERLREVAKLPISAQGAWAFRVATRITGRVVGGFVPVGMDAHAPRSNELGVNPADRNGERSNLYVRQITKYDLIDKPVGRAMVRYSRRPYRGRVVLFWPVELPVNMPSRPVAKWAEITDRSLDWSQVVSDLDIYELPGTGISSVTKDINILLDRLKPCLDKAQESRDGAKG